MRGERVTQSFRRVNKTGKQSVTAGRFTVTPVGMWRVIVQPRSEELMEAKRRI